MQNFKKVSAFLALSVMVTLLMHFFLAAPCRMKNYFHLIHQDNYSTVIVGQSRGSCAFNPYLLDDESGKAFNLSRMVSPVRNFYFEIKEANRDGNLKRAFFEIDHFYFCGSTTGQQVGNGMNLFPYLSPSVQLSYIKDFFFDADYNQVLFDYRINGDILRGIPYRLREKLSPAYIHNLDTPDEYNPEAQFLYMGRGYERNINPTWTPREPVQFEPETVDEESLMYLRKTAEYCRENGIELVCFITPLPPYRILNENHGDVHDYFAEVCRQENIPFIDGNYIKLDFLPRTDDDFADQEGHMLGGLSDIYTELFAEILESPHPEDYFEPNYEAVRAAFMK